MHFVVVYFRLKYKDKLQKMVEFVRLWETLLRVEQKKLVLIWVTNLVRL